MSAAFPVSIFLIDSHTQGEPLRLVVGGLPKIPGNSMVEKNDYVKSKMDYIRHFICNEPRGHSGMFAAILTEPCSKEAEFGVIYFGHVGYAPMCGHGTIAIGTILVDSGMVRVKEPFTEFTLETPAGLIRVKVKVEHGKAKSAAFINVPAFLYKEDLIIDVPSYGKIKGDVAYGGNWFFYVDSKEVDVRVRSENINELIKAGIAIKAEINKKFEFVHPTNPQAPRELRGVSIIDSPVKHKEAHQNNVQVEGEFFDRSPCGTATSARVASLFAKGRLGLNEDFINESITGTVFYGRAIEEVKVGDYRGVIPQISASACITGFNHLVLDSDDPFGAKGFYVGEKI
jgi:proline racemase